MTYEVPVDEIYYKIQYVKRLFPQPSSKIFNLILNRPLTNFNQ